MKNIYFLVLAIAVSSCSLPFWGEVAEEAIVLEKLAENEPRDAAAGT